ncbi:ethylene-responsive transcription factor RAP2-7-like [Salvia divinorum]|uniref:Ethylene-responsive transcription factor RAP2-7-like n=1 Tax=Salvia divinorum TaxID=28513 RepID=A0ABD1GM07_SALDI
MSRAHTMQVALTAFSRRDCGNLRSFQLNVQNANMFKERAGQGRTWLGSTSEEVVKWAWRMHDQVRATQITAAAAAAGFSSPVVSNSASSLSLCFSSNPTNISQVVIVHLHINSTFIPPT